jgi:hypothetical protein
MILEKKIYILIKFNNIEFNNIIINNKLKKFYIQKINLIKNNINLFNIIFNLINIEESWYLIDNKNKKNKLIKDNN